jgi:RHS repeat-associated protein
LIDAADGNAVYRQDGQGHYYHFDGLGSVAALSDVNNVSVERCAYDVFGRPTIRDVNGVEIAESALANPYLFTGRAWDPETALYYYRARYYDYFTGRFLQPDPIGYGDGLNMYLYVGNNPLIFVDPFGLEKEAKREELMELIKKYKELMKAERGNGLVPYKMCYDWAEQTVKWELDTEHYQVREAYGLKEGFGFGPPRVPTPSEVANQELTEGYVEVVDIDTGKVVVTLDPWTPPIPLPLLYDYHLPSIAWVWWGSGQPGNSLGLTPGEILQMGP